VSSRPSPAFPDWQVTSWGDTGATHFALALSRLSGQPLEVSYLQLLDRPPLPVDQLEPHLVAGIVVVDANGRAYRPEGIYTTRQKVPGLIKAAREKGQAAIEKLQLTPGQIHLMSLLTGEAQLRQHRLLGPLREDLIEKWMVAIQANKTYWKKVPVDLGLGAVHDVLWRYARRDCQLYAEALERAGRGQALAFNSTNHHHRHVLVRRDGDVGEDIWGERSIARLTNAFQDPGCAFTREAFEHIRDLGIANIGAEAYEARVKEAEAVVRQRLGIPANQD
jgi:hypothetical protein